MKNEIQKIIAARIAAVKSRNVTEAVRNYSPDVIFYDVIGDLRYTGKDAMKNRLNDWFSSLSEILDYEIVDIKISSGRDMAFCSCLNYINAMAANGNTLDMYWRETTCYVKTEGAWMITHAHSSVPFDAKTGLSSTGLTTDHR